MTVQSFEFAFDYPVAAALAPFGIVPATAGVSVSDGVLEARFGPLWSFRTPVTNIVSAEVTGPYKVWRAIGVRLGLSDRGLTFGSNARSGLLLTFAEPVEGVLPFIGLRHPNATLTVTDPEALRLAISRA